MKVIVGCITGSPTSKQQWIDLYEALEPEATDLQLVLDLELFVPLDDGKEVPFAFNFDDANSVIGKLFDEHVLRQSSLASLFTLIEDEVILSEDYGQQSRCHPINRFLTLIDNAGSCPLPDADLELLTVKFLTEGVLVLRGLISADAVDNLHNVLRQSADMR
ncbi:hypothetical protein BVRB_030860, partial [Beta vulgaris subsp. vulgaris]